MVLQIYKKRFPTCLSQMVRVLHLASFPGPLLGFPSLHYSTANDGKMGGACEWGCYSPVVCTDDSESWELVRVSTVSE